MNTISADHQPFSQPYDLYAYNAFSKTAQATQVTATSQQQKDITVYTREGDKVTLTLGARTQIDYTDYQGQFNQAGALGGPNAAVLELQSVAVQQETVELARDRTLTITVEGDLSDQELSDIKKALQQIDAVMMEVLGKGLSQATADDLAPIRDLDTVAGLEARYYQASTIAVQQTTYQESGLSVAGRSPRDAHSLDMQSPGAQDAATARKTIARLERLVEASKVKPNRLVRPLKGYFNNLFKHFSDQGHRGHRSHQLARQIGNDLIEGLSSRPGNPFNTRAI